MESERYYGEWGLWRECAVFSYWMTALGIYLFIFPVATVIGKDPDAGKD